MNRTREALVGLVIVVAVLVTTFGVLWLQGVTWGEPQVEMEAVFDEVGLVRAGNAVKLRGVQVGRVREIAVDPGGELVRVTFRIGEGLTLPEDAVMVLSPESLFGDWQAEIHPRTRFPRVTFPEPQEADVLPGHALPDISQLTAAADDISESMLVLTERIGIAFSEETAQNIASLIDNIEGVTTQLSTLVEQQAASFAEVTDDVRQATQGIGSAADQARQTLERVDEIIARDEVESALQDLSAIAANMRGVSAELEGTNREVREMAEQVEATFAKVQGMLETVESGEGSLGRLFHDPVMAEELEGAVSELQLLLEDIRENPRRYVRLSIF